MRTLGIILAVIGGLLMLGFGIKGCAEQSRRKSSQVAKPVAKLSPEEQFDYIPGPTIDVPANGWTEMIERNPPGLPMWDKHYLHFESVTADLDIEIYRRKTDTTPVYAGIVSKFLVDSGAPAMYEPSYYLRFRSRAKTSDGKKTDAQITLSWSLSPMPPKRTPTTSASAVK